MNDRIQFLIYLTLALWVAALYCFRYGIVGYFFAVALALSRHCFLNSGRGWTFSLEIELLTMLICYLIAFSPALILSQLYNTYRILKWRRRLLAANAHSTLGAAS